MLGIRKIRFVNVCQNIDLSAMVSLLEQNNNLLKVLQIIIFFFSCILNFVRSINFCMNRTLLLSFRLKVSGEIYW